MSTSSLLLQQPVACTTLRRRPSCFRAGPLRWAARPASAPSSGSGAFGGARTGSSSSRGAPLVVRAADNEGGEKQVKYNTEFGYSRKDVILIGAGMLALGYGSYYGLQATGMDAGMAGNFVQLFVILGISLAWVGSYLFRVATKQMTYVRQLEDYEEAVMAKRLQELPESEMEALLADVEAEKERKAARRQQQQQQQ